MPDVWLRYIRVAEAIAPSPNPAPGPDRPPPTDLVDLLLTPWFGGQAGRNRQATARSIDRRTLENTPRRGVAISDTRCRGCREF